MGETPKETTKVEKPTVEKGGYSSGQQTVTELPPPPPSVSVQAPDKGQETPSASPSERSK